MKKSIVAIGVALVITACVGLGILAVGGAALFNRNGSPILDTPAQVTGNGQHTEQIAQLQDLIAQYQDREKQYQDREQQLQDQLAQVNAQLQQNQQAVQQAQLLLNALQQRGLIRVTNDGRIFILQ